MTLRARLIVALVVVAIAVVTAGFVVVTIQRQYLLDQVDRQLDTSRGAAIGFVRRSEPGFTAPVRPERHVPSDLIELYVAEVSPDGTPLDVVVPGARRFGVPELEHRNIARLANGEPVTVHAAGSDTAYRVQVLQPDALVPNGYIVVALPLDRVDAATRRLVIVMLVAAAVIVGVLLELLYWWVVSLGLRPIRHMTDAADAIASGDLDRRVEDMPPRTEAERLGRAFNLMLDLRLASEEQLRRFVADASHELRTPLTSIRGYTELYRRGGLHDIGALDDAMRRVGQEAARMHDLVEDMLLLARLDEGRPLERTRVDLAQLLRDATNDASAVQPSRPIRLEVPDHALVMTGDENRLRQIVAALLTNALVHTDVSVPIVVRGWEDRDACGFEVEDSGGGMNVDLADRAFGRFVRGDASRGRHHGGSGLGLAIVQSVVHAHGGEVTLRTQPECGTTVRVELSQQGGKSL